MLVLSRREAEKVLFPKLGISVEVTRVQGKTVRLGIQAPQEIRIIRGELAEAEVVDPKTVDPKTSSNNDGLGDNGVAVDPAEAHREIQKNLDAANLAIRLAQNQLRQRLSDHAEEALACALECLEKLEIAISLDSVPEPNELTVQEARSGYDVRSKPVALVVEAYDQDLEVQLSNALNQQGFCALAVENTHSLVDHLQRNQPAVVFTIEAVTPDAQNYGGDEPEPEIRVQGVKGLQNSKRFAVGRKWINGWFADPENSEALVSCLQNHV